MALYITIAKINHTQLKNKILPLDLRRQSQGLKFGVCSTIEEL